MVSKVFSCSRQAGSCTDEERRDREDVKDMLTAARCGATLHVEKKLQVNDWHRRLGPKDGTAVRCEGAAVEFLAGNIRHRAVFRASKLGLTFQNDMPLVVKRVALGSVAQRLGIEQDWVVIAINGIALEGRTWKEALEMLQVAAATLPIRDDFDASQIDAVPELPGSTHSADAPKDAVISASNLLLVTPGKIILPI